MIVACLFLWCSTQALNNSVDLIHCIYSVKVYLYSNKRGRALLSHAPDSLFKSDSNYFYLTECYIIVATFVLFRAHLLLLLLDRRINKKRMNNTEISNLCMFINAFNTLCQGSFIMTSCISVVWRWSATLLWEQPSLCFVGSGVSHLPLDKGSQILCSSSMVVSRSSNQSVLQ